MGATFWALLALVAIIVELLSPALVAGFAAVGAAAAAVAAAVGVPAAGQVTIFAVVTVLALLGLRRLLVPLVGARGTSSLRLGADPLVGRRGTVTCEIEPGGRGQIQVGHERWTAAAYGELPLLIPAGREVQVMAVRGLVALVIDPEALGLSEVRDASRLHR